MWPVLLDMTKEESIQSLRNLELEAYAHLVSALRAQGPLDQDKRRVLTETGVLLNITQDRHKAEVRRAVNDEKLNTIAYHVTGLNVSMEDWAQEGRRTIPLLPRMAPQTVYSAIADEIADTTNVTNRQLPHPACTERKRVASQQPPQTTIQEPLCKGMLPFRVPEPPKMDEAPQKKRRMPICTESSTLAQHLLGSAKLRNTQPIYSRQRAKGPLRDKAMFRQHQQQQHQHQQASKLSFNAHAPQHNLQQLPQQMPCSSSSSGMQTKINVVQNITLPPPPPTHVAYTPQSPAGASASSPEEETIEQIQNEVNSYTVQKPVEPLIPSMSNENHAPARPPKLIPPSLSKPPPSNMAFKPSTTPGPSLSGETTAQIKPVKLVPSKKSTKPVVPAITAQKLIVVSNAQTISNSSILQKTLSIPLVKNLSMKNFEKFKIVTSAPQMGGAAVVTSVAATHNNLASFKQHKVVTLKAGPNSTHHPKKMIPFSQILTTKGGIKVLPIGGKILGKTTVTTTSSSPLYIVNTIGGSAQNRLTVTTVSNSNSSSNSSSISENIISSSCSIISSTTGTEPTISAPSTPSTVLMLPTRDPPPTPPVRPTSSTSKENGMSSVISDITRGSGVTMDDFDAQIEEFHIPNNQLCHQNNISSNSTTQSHVEENEIQKDEEITTESEPEENRIRSQDNISNEDNGANISEVPDEKMATVVEAHETPHEPLPILHPAESLAGN